ncbi:MAG: hypothetical protein ACRDJN_29705, partial [Chloroflexota bacterium]
VAEATARFDGPNRIVVQVPNGAPPALTTLVVMQSAFPGWSAKGTDGAPHAVGAAGGFLSVAGVRPGETYVLSFLPPSFVAGAALSALGLMAVAVLIWLEYRGQFARLHLAERFGRLRGAPRRWVWQS